MKKLIAVFLVLIFLNSNIAIAQFTEQEVRKGRAEKKITKLEVPSEKGIGEDIIINIDSYQPTVIRSSLIEEQGVNVYALLTGLPTNPALTIPFITDIDVRPVRIRTKPEGKKVVVGRIRYEKPRARYGLGGKFPYITRYREPISYSNLGYLIIPIRRIPKEEDVPNEINIEMVAKITLGVSEGLTFGKKEDVLRIQDKRDWEKEKEQHKFFGGYIRLGNIDTKEGIDYATFVIYDSNLNQIATVEVEEGTKSKYIFTRRGLDRLTAYSRVFDRFRIYLKDVRSVGKRAKLAIFKDNVLSTIVLAEGAELYEGSIWKVEEINIKKDYKEVVLLNKDNYARAYLKLEEDILKVEEDEKIREISTKKSLEEDPDIIRLREIRDRLEIKGKENFDDEEKELNVIIKKEGVKDEIKSRAIDLLQQIATIYDSIDRREKANELYQDVLDLRKEKVGVKPVSEAVGDKESYYKTAISYYERLLDPRYQNERDEDSRLFYVKALENIAGLYTELRDEDNAIKTYEKLLEIEKSSRETKYDETELETRINVLKSSIGKYRNRAEYIEDSTGRGFLVTLISIEDVDERKPEVSYILNGRVYEKKLGQTLHSYNNNIWRITEITDKGITVEQMIVEKERELFVRSISLSKGVSKELIEGKAKVKVLSTSIEKEAYIVVEPNIEPGETGATFDIHLNVEKRPFKLPLFSDSLQEEIKKTEDLVRKLDETIKNLENLHNFWINFCYVTFGTLWAKNLLFGDSIVKRKIKDKWVERYKKHVDDTGERISFDQYILRHEQEYNKDFDRAKSVVGRIRNGDPQELKEDFGNVDDEKLNNLYFLREMAKEDPFYRPAYFESRFNMIEEIVDVKIRDNIEGKSLSEIEDEKIRNDLVNRMKEFVHYNKLLEEKKKLLLRRLPSDEAEDEALEEVWRENQYDIINKYRTKFLKEKRDDYFEKFREIDEEIEFGDEVEETRRRLESLFAPSVTYETLDYRKVKPYDMCKKNKDEKGVCWEDSKGNEYKLYLRDEKTGKLKPASSVKTGETYYIMRNGKEEEIQLSEIKETIKDNHQPMVVLYDSGRHKGKVKMISIDSYRYALVEYSAGGVESIDVFQRYKANDRLGAPESLRIDNLEDACKQASAPYSKQVIELETPSGKVRLELGKDNDDLLCREVRTNILRINNEVAKRGYLDISGITNVKGYRVTKEAPSAVSTNNCVDFMSPGDCKILFNACDPVICPVSRCNFAGRWNIKGRSVVETGITGGLVLCAPNWVAFGGNVVMPVCITGILAGLNGVKSILQGYSECLKVHGNEGKSVGICDKVRNIGFCEMFWREIMAVFNAENGILSFITSKVFDTVKGGGEYAGYRANLENALSTAKFFTQNYAKNVFAAYSGGSLDAIGTEICQTAIYGKIPGTGDFFDQIQRPESPPQFIAFFDEVPYTDIPPGEPRSIYSIFYHIYAGNNEDISYSVYLRRVDKEGLTKAVKFIVRNRRLKRGDFADASLDRELLSGYNEICVDIQSDRYGLRSECGFGKVTSSFAVNYATDLYVSGQAKKKITSEEECVPETGRLTSLRYKGGASIVPPSIGTYSGSPNLLTAPIGMFSTGLLQTGVIRKCSGYYPGIGAEEKEGSWVPVGTCGKDEKGRDLGTCWLYKPSLQNVIRDAQRKDETLKYLEKLGEEIKKAGFVRGEEIFESGRVTTEFAKADELKALGKYNEAINLYQNIISHTLDLNVIAKAYFRIGETYEDWGRFITKKVISKEVEEIKREEPAVSREREVPGKEKILEAGFYIKDDKEYSVRDNIVWVRELGSQEEFRKSELIVDEIINNKEFTSIDACSDFNKPIKYLIEKGKEEGKGIGDIKELKGMENLCNRKGGCYYDEQWWFGEPECKDCSETLCYGKTTEQCLACSDKCKLEDIGIKVCVNK